MKRIVECVEGAAKSIGGTRDLSRREFVSATAVGVVGLASPFVQRRPTERRAYIGTYTTDGRSQGIYQLRFNPETGAVRVLDGAAAKSTNPSYLAMHPNGRVLYAANENQEFNGQPSGGVSAFRIDRASGRLTLINAQASQGKAPCYVSLDRTNKYVLVANYVGGTIATLPIRRDGGLGVARSVIEHHGSGPNTARQASPHPHCILPDKQNHHMLVVDLGTDSVLAYRLEASSGKLTVVTPGTALAPGAGPRHLTFHPTSPFAYVANELDSTVTAFRYDSERGAFAELQTTAASPGGIVPNNFPADIHVAPSGKFLYLSNRGENSIAAFAIDAATGRLSPIHQIACGGNWPRNFSFDPTGRFLLVANQRSDSIVVFRVDADTGHLTATDHRVELPVPVCIRF